MKTRITATITTLAVAGLILPAGARAGDREWAVAGKILTGIAAAQVIGHALEPRPMLVYQSAPVPVVYQTTSPAYVANAPVAPAAPVYAPAPTTAVVYQPAPTVVYVAAPVPVYYAARTVVIHPYGHFFRPRHCFSRW